MGFSTNLKPVGHFYYQSDYENGLAEHEYDHLFTGIYNAGFQPNPAEVMNTRWVNRAMLKTEMQETPEHFTSWFRLIMNDPGIYNTLWNV